MNALLAIVENDGDLRLWTVSDDIHPFDHVDMCVPDMRACDTVLERCGFTRVGEWEYSRVWRGMVAPLMLTAGTRTRLYVIDAR